MRSQYTLKLLNLILIIPVWGCSWTPQSTIPDRHEYKSFNLAVGGGQKQEMNPIGKALRESIKDKLTQKGYIYKETSEHVDLKGVIQYQVLLIENQYFQLDVTLDIYEAPASQKVWSASASNTVRSQDIVADLIQPIARQLTLKFPYAAHLGGIGVIISRDLKIRDFSPKSPAREVGLKVDDLITKVDGKEVKELNECQGMLKGKVNTQVGLTVKRDQQELHFIVSRISLNQMMKRTSFINEVARGKQLEENFRKKVLQQP